MCEEKEGFMQYTICCPCLFGLEGLVAQELRELGLQDVRSENGRVLFSGDMEAVAWANINSRYSERVMILAGEFSAESFEELFEGVKGIAWEAYLGKLDAFPVSGSCLSSKLHSVPDCQGIIKKAIVERLKQKHRIAWFEETGPLHKIRFRILKNTVSVMIDTSGEGLHKRGYRRQSTEAPIKETLAAAMVNLSRLRSDGQLYDPMCGSGTILIEGAMQAMRMAPGLRRRFVAETWQEAPPVLWAQRREAAAARIRRDVTFHGTAFDIDPEAVALTLENAKKAGVETHVSAKVQDIRKFQADGPSGCVICNPPYGERLLSMRETQTQYRTLGQVFPPKSGWSYGVITPDEGFEALFGRRADKRRKLYNGMIKCQFYQFFKTPKGN